MLSRIRDRFGPYLVGGIIAFIAFVFIFSDFARPKSTSGMHDSAVAGIVNGDPVTLSEFNRAYQQRIEMFKSMGGGLTEEQLRMFRIRESVFSELANRKLMSQEAKRFGLLPGDEEVRSRVSEFPAFQKDGKFDRLTYRQVLEANGYTPGGFEKLIREDAALARWSGLFKGMARASREEVRREFLMSKNRRNLRYVTITPDSARKAVSVSDDEIAKLLADTQKANLVKLKYDEGKETQYKGKTFDQVKNEIARDEVAAQKPDELRKIADEYAKKAEGALTAEASPTATAANDAKVAALLKPVGGSAKATGMITANAGFIPGIGEGREILKDAFASPSPIALKPKAYALPGGGWAVVVLAGAETPDLSKFDEERPKLARQIAFRKERSLFEGWTKKLNASAKIERNADIAGGSAEGS